MSKMFQQSENNRMTGLVDLAKKVIGKVHKPTAISAIEDEIIETKSFIQYHDDLSLSYSLHLRTLRRRLQELHDE